MSFREDIAPLLVGACVGLFVGFLIGVFVADRRQEAVDAGHAEWAVDQKTGSVCFQWKMEPEK